MASVRLRLGRKRRFVAHVEATPADLLAIGAMVAMMLLGSARIVDAARR